MSGRGGGGGGGGNLSDAREMSRSLAARASLLNPNRKTSVFDVLQTF